jgi:hypothetical protein
MQYDHDRIVCLPPRLMEPSKLVEPLTRHDARPPSAPPNSMRDPCDDDADQRHQSAEERRQRLREERGHPRRDHEADVMLTPTVNIMVESPAGSTSTTYRRPCKRGARASGRCRDTLTLDRHPMARLVFAHSRSCRVVANGLPRLEGWVSVGTQFASMQRGRRIVPRRAEVRLPPCASDVRCRSGVSN